MQLKQKNWLLLILLGGLLVVYLVANLPAEDELSSPSLDEYFELQLPDKLPQTIKAGDEIYIVVTNNSSHRISFAEDFGALIYLLGANGESATVINNLMSYQHTNPIILNTWQEEPNFTIATILPDLEGANLPVRLLVILRGVLESDGSTPSQVVGAQIEIEITE